MNKKKVDARFHQLRRELAEQGCFDRKPARIIAQLGIFIAATLIGIGLLVKVDNLLVDGLAMLLITLAGMGVSTNAHSASHNSVSHKKWVNKLLTYFGYPFFLQVSVTYWNHKHLVVHHPNPNVVGVDDDADLFPYFAINQDELSNVSGLRRWYYEYQWLFLPVLMVANAFNVVFTGWRFLIGQMLDKKTRKLRHWLDLSVLVLHWVVWVLLPMMVFAPMDVMLFTLVRFGMISYGMFVLFAPAHFPEEAVMLDPKAVTNDRVRLQTATTVNFRTGPLGRLLCAGVEYQIEHHLFPTISHVHYPKASKLMRQYCEEHGYPYRTFGWWEAIWKSIIVFYRPKPVVNGAKPVDGTSDRAETARVPFSVSNAEA